MTGRYRVHGCIQHAGGIEGLVEDANSFADSFGSLVAAFGVEAAGAV